MKWTRADYARNAEATLTAFLEIRDRRPDWEALFNRYAEGAFDRVTPPPGTPALRAPRPTPQDVKDAQTMFQALLNLDASLNALVPTAAEFIVRRPDGSRWSYSAVTQELRPVDGITLDGGAVYLDLQALTEVA